MLEFGGKRGARVRHGQQGEVREHPRRRILGEMVRLEYLKAAAHQGALQAIGPERRVAEQQDSWVGKGATRSMFSHGESIDP
jgi:hypothetical protein